MNSRNHQGYGDLGKRASPSSSNPSPSASYSAIARAPPPRPSNRSTNLPPGLDSLQQRSRLPLPSAPFSDDDDDDDGDTESGGSEDGDPRSSLGNWESSTFEGYLGTLNRKDGDGELSSWETGLSKIRQLLVASKSGALACLICLERVRVTDPVWDCKLGCHAAFHLICIQAWARQASSAAAERATNRLSREHFPSVAEVASQAASWHCPKCRTDYPQAQIPREYRCFCGKYVDPAYDPWLTPHTCGEICGRLLPGDCGHECKLLCHPGPCPSCPQFVKASCFCGGESEVRRCAHKRFSCGKLCRRRLSCGIHNCRESCHEGACPPCKETGLHSCKCGRTTELRACAESDYQCDQTCDKELNCKKHLCKRVCHSGACGGCELQGKRTCPCSKVEYKGLACDVAAPTCGSTCDKMLPCSLHRCQERCHFGSCNTTCRVVTTKFCRCGSGKKEVPCHQDLQCERKCQRLRDCTRHSCRRRCCDGDCPPCSEVCGRKLRCGNHKCPAPCHRGTCAPCPVIVRIACSCGATSIEVPCGTEKEQRPPRCSRRCLVPPECRHGMDCKSHRCHYGACPPCRMVCDEELPCGHKCKRRCHGPRPPPNPEFTLKPKKKRKGPLLGEQISGSPCPACPERVLRQCLGQHPGGERMMVCSESSDFECGRPCGNVLACRNHFCEKQCHKITLSHIASEESQIDAKGDLSDAGLSCSSSERNRSLAGAEIIDSCDECVLPCQKKREPFCPHPCMQPCHPGECRPCMTLIKRPCYCGTLVHVFECSLFNTLPEEDRKQRLSCGGPCHRKLPHCTHLCPEICHPGPCRLATSCQKKVTVRCSCQRQKKEWTCFEVQSAYKSRKIILKDGSRGPVGIGLLACDQDCSRLAEHHKMQEDDDQIRQRKSAVVEDSPLMKMPKRRKSRGSVDLKSEKSKIKQIGHKTMKWAVMVVLVLVLGLFFYYGYRGLQALSDWMNALDATRPRKRPPGSLVR